MERVQWELDAPGLDRPGTVIRYGHWGRPVLVFPSEQGRAWDYENNGMVAAVADLVEAGRAKLYCVDAFDHVSWSDRSLPLEERARRHQAYEAWIHDQVVPLIGEDTPGATDAVVTGCSLGAYHAVQLALTRADLFPVAICQSGNYDPSEWHAWGERGDAAYFTNPTDYVAHLHGDHLDWLRSRLHVVLVVGEGPWETHPTGSLPSAHRLAALLAERGLPHELDVWGHDSAHDWPWWQRQIAHHLPRFC
ncbi:esterase family protein [Nocardioides coralli]|uniref:esterase family protein n=1 Tax=Nocardioides coralli TaxID=2872154 RepID=UPI001CA3AFC7|nr:alpha/beta hydrolase-fold protein [Nocardioides coralli]QZY28947.1 esterase [Nocardioides coralli]